MDDDLFLSKVVEGCIAHGGLSARDGRRSPFVTGTDVVGWRSPFNGSRIQSAAQRKREPLVGVSLKV